MSNIKRREQFQSWSDYASYLSVNLGIPVQYDRMRGFMLLSDKCSLYEENDCWVCYNSNLDKKVIFRKFAYDGKMSRALDAAIKYIYKSFMFVS